METGVSLFFATLFHVGRMGREWVPSITGNRERLVCSSFQNLGLFSAICFFVVPMFLSVLFVTLTAPDHSTARGAEGPRALCLALSDVDCAAFTLICFILF